MIRKEFVAFLNSGTRQTQASKVGHLVSALAKLNIMPNYKNPLTPYEIGFALWVYGAGPSVTHSKLTTWVKGQLQRLMAAWNEKAINSIPSHAIANLLLDFKKTKSLESLAIHNQTGAIYARWENGKMECLCNYSTIHSDNIDYAIKDMTIFSGEFIKDLAYRIRLDYLLDSYDRKVEAKKAIQKLKEAIV